MITDKINLRRSRYLRKHSTDAELRIWYWLRKRNFSGYRFRRQAVLGCYIVDFVCYELKLIIELDGGQHNLINNIIYDKKRTQWLEK